MKKSKGITLIALAITIAILLILAGVSITMLKGENGLIVKAKEARLKDDNAKVYEALKLIEINNSITQQDLIKKLQEDKIIDNNYIVNVQELLGTKLSTGNGKGTTDVYKLEEITELGKIASVETVELASSIEEKNYMVVYYNEKGKRTELGTLEGSIEETETGYYDGLDVTPTDSKYFEFSYNEDTKTATLTKVKDTYAAVNYYNEEKYVNAVTDGDLEITDVVIPAVISKGETDYKVTEIGEDSFCANGHSRFSSFVIPDTVAKVQRRAFRYCGNATFRLSKNLTDIGEEAFVGCKKLTNIDKDKLTKLTTIGEEAFWASGLTHVSLPDGITSLELGVFRDCDSLENITLPDSLTTIKCWAFEECNSLKILTIPAGVREIDPRMWDSSGVEKLTVDERNSTFDSRENCNAIIETRTNTLVRASVGSVDGLAEMSVPNGVTVLGDYAFSHCDARTISLPESVVEIGSSAFEFCRKLESVNIPNGVSEIKDHTFRCCDALTNIMIPKSVKKIEQGTWAAPFSQCTNLTITIEAGSSLIIPEDKWGAKAVIKE